MKEGSNGGGRFRGVVNSRRGLVFGVRAAGLWKAVCRDPLGRVKWQDEFHNIVVNQGLDHILDVVLSAGTQITSWFIGLTDGTPTPAAADTMDGGHAGWTEVTAYDEATRQAFTDGGVSSQSIDNVGNEAVFTISANGTTVGGAFLVSSSTKGSSAGGQTLYSAGPFAAGDKTIDDNDTLTITATFTQADDGA